MKVEHASEKSTERNPAVVRLLSSLPESTASAWAKFVPGALAETNERNLVPPATGYTNATGSSSDDEDTDFRDMQFPPESALQQVKQ